MDFPFSELWTLASWLWLFTMGRGFSITHHYEVKTNKIPDFVLISRLKKGHIFHSFFMHHVFQALNHFSVTLRLFPNLSISVWFWQSTRCPLTFLSFLLSSCLPSVFLPSFLTFNYALIVCLCLVESTGTSFSSYETYCQGDGKTG